MGRALDPEYSLSAVANAARIVGLCEAGTASSAWFPTCKTGVRRMRAAFFGPFAFDKS
jgi:hypothetical protein